MDKRTCAALVAVVLLAVTGLSSPAHAAGGDAVTYQQNAKHDGFSAAGVAKPPLTERWRRALGDSVSYPVIAAGGTLVAYAGPAESFRAAGGGR